MNPQHGPFSSFLYLPAVACLASKTGFFSSTNYSKTFNAASTNGVASLGTPYSALPLKIAQFPEQVSERRRM
jgi:hypothetical protein